jgi:hypothetical protein
MKLRIIVALLSLGAWTARTSAQQTPTIFPFDPAQLLVVLPAAPADWKVIRSEAENTLGEWLETRATRVFQAPPSPVADAGAATSALPPAEIEITVVDTAGFAPALATFANFTPGKVANIEKKLTGTLPTIIITNENERQFVQVLVAARYIVELTMTNLPRPRVDDWLRSFHFDALPPASKTPTNRPREFRLAHIDELQPKNNRTLLVSTTNSKRVDDFLKTLPTPAPDPASIAADSKPQP